MPRSVWVDELGSPRLPRGSGLKEGVVLNNDRIAEATCRAYDDLRACLVLVGGPGTKERVRWRLARSSGTQPAWSGTSR